MKYVIVDIDGTITDVSHRLHHISGKKKDWNAFNEACVEDTPNVKIVELVGVLWRHGYKIVFCTGRSELYRQRTVDMLFKYFWNNPNYILLMRRNGDKRSDVVVKPELLKEFGVEINDIELVLEDRSRMVDMWRKMGITCLQVAKGDF